MEVDVEVDVEVGAPRRRLGREEGDGGSCGG